MVLLPRAYKPNVFPLHYNLPCTERFDFFSECPREGESALVDQDGNVDWSLLAVPLEVAVRTEWCPLLIVGHPLWFNGDPTVLNDMLEQCIDQTSCPAVAIIHPASVLAEAAFPSTGRLDVDTLLREACLPLHGSKVKLSPSPTPPAAMHPSTPDLLAVFAFESGLYGCPLSGRTPIGPITEMGPSTAESLLHLCDKLGAEAKLLLLIETSGPSVPQALSAALTHPKVKHVLMEGMQAAAYRFSLSPIYRELCTFKW